jgi:GntR family transcriptional regulator
MSVDFQADRSIYLQIAEHIEDSILQEALAEEEQVPSTNQLAALYRINPATAGKGVNMLVDEGILYKKRGIGMFVASKAREKIRDKRRVIFYDRYIQPLLAEASHLGISPPDLCTLILSRNGQEQVQADRGQRKEGAAKP